jgi:hypothetical protein
MIAAAISRLWFAIDSSSRRRRMLHGGFRRTSGAVTPTLAVLT